MPSRDDIVFLAPVNRQRMLSRKQGLLRDRRNVNKRGLLAPLQGCRLLVTLLRILLMNRHFRVLGRLLQGARSTL